MDHGYRQKIVIEQQQRGIISDTILEVVQIVLNFQKLTLKKKVMNNHARSGKSFDLGVLS